MIIRIMAIIGIVFSLLSISHASLDAAKTPPNIWPQENANFSKKIGTTENTEHTDRTAPVNVAHEYDKDGSRWPSKAAFSSLNHGCDDFAVMSWHLDPASPVADKYDYDAVGLLFVLNEDSRDPLSLHKYVYCQGNPVNGWDPSGHYVESDLGIRGVKAHMCFSLYCLSRGIPCVPDRPLKDILPHLFNSSTPGANEKPDCVDQANLEYYELKPLSHRDNTWLQFEDAAQMYKYDCALMPHSFGRGDSSAFASPGTLAGSFEHEGQQWAVLLYPATVKTSGGYDGRGLIYYDLKEIKPQSPLQRLLMDSLAFPIAIPAGYKVAQQSSLQVGKWLAAKALAKTVPLAVEAGIETRVGLQVVVSSATGL